MLGRGMNALFVKCWKLWWLCATRWKRIGSIKWTEWMFEQQSQSKKKKNPFSWRRLAANRANRRQAVSGCQSNGRVSMFKLDLHVASGSCVCLLSIRPSHVSSVFCLAFLSQSHILCPQFYATVCSLFLTMRVCSSQYVRLDRRLCVLVCTWQCKIFSWQCVRTLDTAKSSLSRQEKPLDLLARTLVCRACLSCLWFAYRLIEERKHIERKTDQKRFPLDQWSVCEKRIFFKTKQIEM